MYELGTLYTEHKLTMRDLSQQSALIQNPEFQKYAQSTFTPTEVTELAKLVVQNNKNPGVRLAVENLKKTTAVRKPSVFATSSAIGTSSADSTTEAPVKKTITDSGTVYEESEKGILMPKEK